MPGKQPRGAPKAITAFEKEYPPQPICPTTVTATDVETEVSSVGERRKLQERRLLRSRSAVGLVIDHSAIEFLTI
jgi:hypothetical protein